MHMHYHKHGVCVKIRRCTFLRDRRSREAGQCIFNMFNPLLRLLFRSPLQSHSSGAMVVQSLTAPGQFKMFVRPHHRYPSEQCERLPSYLEVCLSTAQPQSLQKEVNYHPLMGPIELNAQEQISTFELPPIYSKDQDVSKLTVSAGLMGRQSQQKGLLDPAPLQSRQLSRSVTPDESPESVTCFSETSTPSQTRTDVSKDDVVYRMSAPGHQCQQVGFEDDQERACRRSEYENATCTYSDSESCRDSHGQCFRAPIREPPHDYDEIPSLPPRQGWYDPDDKYSRSTIEFTRSWPRAKLLTAFWSLPRRPTYGHGRPRPNEMKWDKPEPRIGDFPNYKAFKAAYRRWSHRQAEHDRRGRHFLVQTDTAISTPEAAYVLADRDPFLQARWRSANSKGAASSKMPGKDDQLFGSAYMHRFSAVVVHSEHEGRLIAETRVEKLETQIQKLHRQLTSDRCNE